MLISNCLRNFHIETRVNRLWVVLLVNAVILISGVSEGKFKCKGRTAIEGG